MKPSNKNRSVILFLVALVLLSLFSPSIFSQTNFKELVKLEPVELNKYAPSQFKTSEWYMPYYLKHFSEVANSVVDSGINKGYIDISVWRSEAVNKPYDARIMENIMSLAWFYTQKRDWNPYYNNPDLKARLEAAFTFWCNMQNIDGRFSEYAYNKWSLAPTAFATKFVGRALNLIEEGNPKIDTVIFNRAVESLRKALYISFTNKELWTHGRNFTNQYANLWGGALMYLNFNSDPEIEALFRKKLQESILEFQSPCGFFYEKGGPDWGYNLSTHHSDLHVAWHFTRETDLQDIFVEKTRQWYDWFSYNALLEPGTSCFYLNRAIETRQYKGFYDVSEIHDPARERWVPQAEYVEMARAFVLSKEELEASEQIKYEEMAHAFPEVAPLEVGEFRAFSPYAFVHQGLTLWLPSQEEKDKALLQLPYIKNKKFIQIRSDHRSNTKYTFIRRPMYYAIYNSGKKITEQQCYGLGLIWNEEMGTIFQSQSKTNEAAYGTKAADEEQVYEAKDIFPEFKVNEKRMILNEAINDLNADSLIISYKLDQKGEKLIRFLKDKINISVEHTGKFTEILPLLVSPEDVLTFDNSSIVLDNNKGECIIKLNNALEIKKIPFQSDLVNKACIVFEIEANKKLSYDISFKIP